MAIELDDFIVFMLYVLSMSALLSRCESVTAVFSGGCFVYASFYA